MKLKGSMRTTKRFESCPLLSSVAWGLRLKRQTLENSVPHCGMSYGSLGNTRKKLLSIAHHSLKVIKSLYHAEESNRDTLSRIKRDNVENT